MALSIPTSTAAALIAQQIISQVNSTLTRIESILEEGQPANVAAKLPAISALDIQSALGVENLQKIKAALTALS